MVEADSEKMALIASNGLYDFSTMPPGPCNIVVDFQQLMQIALVGVFLISEMLCLDNIQERRVNLEIVLDHLRDEGLALKPKKYIFFPNSSTPYGK